MQNSIFGVPVLKIIQLTLFVSLSSAKYLPQIAQNGDILTTRQIYQSTQNRRYPYNNNLLSTKSFDRQPIEKRRENRNKMTSSSGNSPAENMRTGLSIRIGNHQIKRTANGLHVQLGINSNKFQSRNNKNGAQNRIRNVAGAQNGEQQKNNLHQSKSSGITRIILMRNRNNGPRRNLILKTSRGTRIHISRNNGKGSGIRYVIKTGSRVSSKPNINNRLPVSNNNHHLQNSASNWRNVKIQFPSLNNKQELQNSDTNRYNMNNQLPVLNNAYGTQGFFNSGFGPNFETTTRQALSTTEPEDFDWFP